MQASSKERRNSEYNFRMSPDWYDRFVDEVKRFHPLATKPRRNKLGEVVIGYNHPARDAEASTEDYEQLLTNDVDYALSLAPKMFKTFNEAHPVRRNVMVHLCFYLGKARLKRWSNLVDAINTENWSRAAIEIVNHKPNFGSNPQLAKTLAERLLKTR